MFRIDADAYLQLTRQARDEYPLEACGLLAGPMDDDGLPGDTGLVYYPCRNAAASARVYTIDPMDYMKAENDADDRGWEINAVVHSHTHSEAYPSPTDIGAAVSPDWHYVIVTLSREAPEARSFRIVDGEVVEEEVTIVTSRHR